MYSSSESMEFPVLGFMSADQVLFTVYRQTDHCGFSLRRESSMGRATSAAKAQISGGQFGVLRRDISWLTNVAALFV